MDEITCKAHLKSLESLKELKEACRICENYCNRIYYKDIHGSEHKKTDEWKLTEMGLELSNLIKSVDEEKESDS